LLLRAIGHDRGEIFDPVLVDVYEQAGVNLNQVVIGHLNDITDQPTVAPLTIAKRGAYVGFDHSGRPDDPRLQEYVRTIMAILEAGYVDKVCLSSDFSNGKYLRKNGGPGIATTMTDASSIILDHV